MQGGAGWVLVSVTQRCTKNCPVGYGWRSPAGISGARLLREKICRVRVCCEVPAPGVSASKQSQEIPERPFEAQEQTSHIFPHRARQAANKTSFSSPGSKALKPPFNVKYRCKPVSPLHVLGVYVEF